MQDELFRLKREENDTSSKLERGFSEAQEARHRKVDERLAKIEGRLDQVGVKIEHELPKQVTKVANKLVQRTEKKLVGLLKDQSNMIENLQGSYKEKLVAARESLLESIKQAQS